MTDTSLMLGLSGLLLFAIGLLLGFAIPLFRNTRMALSAHLTAAQTGPTLIAIALFWQYCAVPTAWEGPLALALGASSYNLVFGIALAALTGASNALPMAGKGYRASAFAERVVTVLVGGSSIIMMAAIGCLCWFASLGLA